MSRTPRHLPAIGDPAVAARVMTWPKRDIIEVSWKVWQYQHPDGTPAEWLRDCERWRELMRGAHGKRR